jgi:hypothetical protein
MMQQHWQTIPLMKCISLDETLAFWEMIGFQRTYYLNGAYQYGIVKQHNCELHFHQVKKPVTAGLSNGGCLMIVSDVEQLHAVFTQKWKAGGRKMPGVGLPRITRMKPGQTRFTVTDPSGNAVIFIQQGEKDNETYQRADDSGLSALQKSIARAIRFRDFKEDDGAAAKTLDVALQKDGKTSKVDTAYALVIRMEIAMAMEDAKREGECLEELGKMKLSKEEIRLLKMLLPALPYSLTDIALR